MKSPVSQAARPLAALLTIASPAASLAQSEGAAADAPAANSRTYLPAEFSRFAPRTALDMVRQIPGFLIQQPSNQDRGLGQKRFRIFVR